ncbi:MAG: CRISPR system precrRNA processing endoribonuclease RAMP protein Cas6 [Alphaproteobacteria bacterium]|nr:CRISPR system precrRNA processing endoribonuclease RAMP protein Cas6 [Alphaproteobacteria bacterium]
MLPSPSVAALFRPSPSIAPPAWMHQLAVTRVTADLDAPRAWRLPPDPMVTLRGAMGKAVMALACTQATADCPQCPRQGSCPVTTWYDPGRLGGSPVRPLVPHRVRATEHGVQLTFWLLGDVPRPGLVLEALHHMAAAGLGRDRIPHHVRQVVVEGTGAAAQVVRDEIQTGIWPAPGHLGRFGCLPQAPVGARVHLLSPTTWRGLTRAAPPSVEDLLQAAVRRVRAVAHAQGVRVERWWPTEGAGRWLETRWVRATRWAPRHQRRLDLSGWMGTLEIGPAAAELADLLAAAEVLGIGRQASAGRGRIRVEWLPGGR